MDIGTVNNDAQIIPPLSVEDCGDVERYLDSNPKKMKSRIRRILKLQEKYVGKIIHDQFGHEFRCHAIGMRDKKEMRDLKEIGYKPSALVLIVEYTNLNLFAKRSITENLRIIGEV